MAFRHCLLCAAAAVAVAAATLVHPVGGQQPPNAAKEGVVVETREDGTLIERTLDGKVLRTFQGRLPAGGQNTAAPRVEYREEEFIEKGPDGVETRRFVQVPVVVRGVGNSPYGPAATDAESQKLMSQEQAAAQEARALSVQSQTGSDEAKADAKQKLRDKLAEIFDLQQERRTREIAKIEERLGKLKDIVKKRETAKDSIVDRRLEILTGGVDELGWEESFPTQVISPGYGPAGNSPPAASYPPTVPRFDTPDGTRAPVPVPPPAGPAGGAPPPFPAAAPPTPPVAPAAPVPPAAPRR